MKLVVADRVVVVVWTVVGVVAVVELATVEVETSVVVGAVLGVVDGLVVSVVVGAVDADDELDDGVGVVGVVGLVLGAAGPPLVTRRRRTRLVVVLSGNGSSVTNVRWALVVVVSFTRSASDTRPPSVETPPPSRLVHSWSAATRTSEASRIGANLFNLDAPEDAGNGADNGPAIVPSQARTSTDNAAAGIRE